MIESNQDWSYETFPIQDHVCPCCNDRYQLASGIIRDEEGAELAMYVANLTAMASPKQVLLFVMFNDTKRAKRRDRVVSLVLQMDKGEVATSVVDAEMNPLGRAMTRRQVLASPLKSLIFEITDFVVDNDPHIRPFLEEDPTTQDQNREPL